MKELLPWLALLIKRRPILLLMHLQHFFVKLELSLVAGVEGIICYLQIIARLLDRTIKALFHLLVWEQFRMLVESRNFEVDSI